MKKICSLIYKEIEYIVVELKMDDKIYYGTVPVSETIRTDKGLKLKREMNGLELSIEETIAEAIDARKSVEDIKEMAIEAKKRGITLFDVLKEREE